MDVWLCLNLPRRVSLCSILPFISSFQQIIVRITRSFGKTKLYTLNADSIITKRILDLEKALISDALSKERIDIVETIPA